MRTRSNPVYCGVDTIDLAQATKLIQSIAGGPKPAVGGIKLGLEFFLAHGAPGVRYAFPTPVRATGVGFFLDLKLHDIPNTVAGGIRAVVELAPTFITIHASGGRDAEGGGGRSRHAGRQAQRAAAEAPGRDGAHLARPLRPRGDRRQCRPVRPGAAPGGPGARSGLDGVICSPLEIAALRKQCGPDFVLMVPGIRPVGSAANDQKRAMTPRQAVDLGATNLVVGRPIYQAADPRAAAEAIAREAGVNDL